MQLQLIAIEDLPEVGAGADLARLLVRAFRFQADDVLVLAQKIVSKAESRLVNLNGVRPSPEAQELAGRTEKDPRIVELILKESRQVLRARRGVLIVEDVRGWVCANAGIDRSNIPQDDGSEVVSLLPVDPDRSALHIRRGIEDRTGVGVGVVIADSHGRAWRDGTVGVAIGSAGVRALVDERGKPDRHGYLLQHTLIGTADEVSSAASLLMGQGDEGRPAVIVRGLHIRGEGGAATLQRPRNKDLFR